MYCFLKGIKSPIFHQYICSLIADDTAMTFYPSHVDDIVLSCLVKGSNGVKHVVVGYGWCVPGAPEVGVGILRSTWAGL